MCSKENVASFEWSVTPTPDGMSLWDVQILLPDSITISAKAERCDMGPSM